MEPHKLQRLIMQKLAEAKEEQRNQPKQPYIKTDFGSKCESYGCILWCDGCVEDHNKHTCIKETCDQDVGFRD